MAAVSINPLSRCKHTTPFPVQIPRNSNSRLLSIVSCKSHNQFDNHQNKEQKGLLLQQLIAGAGRLGKGVKDNLSPKHKGDWKDVTLMSLSFAVYVYMSQKIVCAYCAWMSMAPSQPW